MIAAEIISKDIIPIQTKDTGRGALMVMSDHYVKHLPVLKDSDYKGMISEETLLDHSMDEPIEEVVSDDFRYIINQDDHLFTVMGKMSDLKMTVLPVFNNNSKYIGAIKQEELLSFYSTHFSINEPGSIIVITLNRRDYSLATISRIIESEGSHVLSSFITKNHIDENIILTLKLDKLEINSITATLERMGYEIKASYQEAEYFNDLQDNYDAFMHYLNI